jgi:hypothetical protein
MFPYSDTLHHITTHTESNSLYSMEECATDVFNIQEWAANYYAARKKQITTGQPFFGPHTGGMYHVSLERKHAATTPTTSTRTRNTKLDKHTPGRQKGNYKHAIAFYSDYNMVMDPEQPNKLLKIADVFPKGVQEQGHTPNNLEFFQLFYINNLGGWIPWCCCDKHKQGGDENKRQATRPDFTNGNGKTLITGINSSIINLAVPNKNNV